VPRLKLHQDVHVTVGSEVIAQHRPEECQPADVMPAAKVSEPGAVNRNSSHLDLRLGECLVLVSVHETPRDFLEGFPSRLH
jgi:hypothetical protein